MVKIRGAGVKIDTELIKDEVESLRQAVEKTVVYEARTVLKDYLSKLRQASSNRESQLKKLGVEKINLGSKDDPFQKHFVTVKKHGDIVRVFVAQRGSHVKRNIFTLLDSGRGEQTKTMVFPKYKGNTTIPDSLDVDPNGVEILTKIVRSRKTGKVRKMPQMAFVSASNRKKSSVGPTEPRNIYATLAQHLEDTVLRTEVESKRKTIKLKALDKYVVIKEVKDG